MICQECGKVLTNEEDCYGHDCEVKIKPKVWACGHTEDEHCFADTMFCVRDPQWFKKYQEETK